MYISAMVIYVVMCGWRKLYSSNNVRYPTLLSVSVFTAVSPLPFSYESLCFATQVRNTMALILPWETVQPAEQMWKLDADLVALIDDAYRAAVTPLPLDVDPDDWFTDIDMDLGTKSEDVTQSDVSAASSDDTEQQRGKSTVRRTSPRGHGSVADVAGAKGSADSEKSENAGPGTSDTPGTELLAKRPGFKAFRAQVSQALKAVCRNQPKPKVHTLLWNYAYKHAEIDRSKFNLSDEQLDWVRAQNGVAKADPPDQYAALFTIHTWDEQLAKFSGAHQQPIDLERYEGSDTSRMYAASAPLEFDRALAVAGTKFVENIMYSGKSYAAACRHHTLKYDTHPWCYRCYILSGFIPCTTATSCVYCARLPKSVGKARDAIVAGSSAWTIEDAVERLGRNMLPRRIIFQIDANVLSLLRGSKVTSPAFVPATWMEALCTHYGVPWPPPPPSERSPASKKRRKTDAQSEQSSASSVSTAPGAHSPAASSSRTRTQRKSPRKTGQPSTYSEQYTVVTGATAGERLLYDKDTDTMLTYDPDLGVEGANIVDTSGVGQPVASTSTASGAVSLADFRIPKSEPGADEPDDDETLTAHNPRTGLISKVSLRPILPKLPEPWQSLTKAILGDCGMSRTQIAGCPMGAYCRSAFICTSNKRLKGELRDILRGVIPVRQHEPDSDLLVLAVCKPDDPMRLHPPLITEIPQPARKFLFKGATAKAGLTVSTTKVTPPTARSKIRSAAPGALPVKGESTKPVISSDSDLEILDQDPALESGAPGAASATTTLTGVLGTVKTATQTDIDVKSEGATKSCTSEQPVGGNPSADNEDQGTAPGAGAGDLALGVCAYRPRRTLSYLPPAGRIVPDEQLFVVDAAQGELQRVFRRDDRENLIVFDIGKPIHVTWQDVENNDRGQLALLLRNFVRGGEEYVSYHPIHSIGWYNRVAAIRHQAGPLYVEEGWPMTLRYRQPALRPTDFPALTQLSLHVGPREHSAWNGLSELAARFLDTRMGEYANVLKEVADENLLTHVFTSNTVPINTERYLPAQERVLPIQALGPPSEETWQHTLAGYIDRDFAYPVPDRALRYAEELARLRLYTLAQRESELDQTEGELAGVLTQLEQAAPQLHQQMCQIIGKMMNRATYAMMDDYASASEQLCHLVVTRRQGFLGAAPFRRERVVEALGHPITFQDRILP